MQPFSEMRSTRSCALYLAAALALSACTIERQGAEAPRDTTYRIDSVIVPEPFRPSMRDTTSDASTLLPVDEASEAPDFLSFRMHFLEAVGARDTSALYNMMSEDVRIGFGISNGEDGFREMWRPSHPDSEVWQLLARVLGGGGLYEDGPLPTEGGLTASGRFRAPYYFAAFPGETYDAFQHGVIVRSDVTVRADPRSGAPAIDTLSFAIVRVPDFAPYEGGDADWIRVELDDERFGYVRSDLIASPIGYRAVFHRIDEEWYMTAFLAGD